MVWTATHLLLRKDSEAEARQHPSSYACTLNHYVQMTSSPIARPSLSSLPLASSTTQLNATLLALVPGTPAVRGLSASCRMEEDPG